jgi:hypothetical protein
MSNRVPQHLIDELFKKGIKPGAYVQCLADCDDVGTVPPVDKWEEDPCGAVFFRHSDAGQGKIFISSSTRKSWATVLSPSPLEDKEEGLKITKEQVLEAAKKSSEADEVLRALFPDVFVPDGPFDFGEEYSLSTRNDGPLVIAHGHAPTTDLRNKCLYVHPHYEMKEQWSGRFKILTFYKKS